MTTDQLHQPQEIYLLELIYPDRRALTIETNSIYLFAHADLFPNYLNAFLEVVRELNDIREFLTFVIESLLAAIVGGVVDGSLGWIRIGRVDGSTAVSHPSLIFIVSLLIFLEVGCSGLSDSPPFLLTQILHHCLFDPLQGLLIQGG